MDELKQNRVSSICSECGAPIEFPLGAQQIKCSHCDAGLIVGEGARLIRLGCPCCGGNFYYLDGSMGGHCPYCDASLLAICQDRVLRYIIRPKTSQPADAPQSKLMLLPFWHLGGLIYGWNIGSHVSIEQEGKKSYDGAASRKIGKTLDRTSTRNDSGLNKICHGRV